MSDIEKFEGFKEKMVEENEKKYGKEVRGKYGDKRVDESKAKIMNMSQEEYEKVTGLEEEIKKILGEAFQNGDPGSEAAQNAADLHRQWISFYWGHYSKEAHAGLPRCTWMMNDSRHIMMQNKRGLPSYCGMRSTFIPGRKKKWNKQEVPRYRLIRVMIWGRT